MTRRTDQRLLNDHLDIMVRRDGRVVLTHIQGYHCAGRWWLVDVPDGTPIADEDHGCADGPARSCREREALGIAAAWAHHKARHDPPGLRTRPWGGGGWVFHCSLVIEPRPRSVMVGDDGRPYTSEVEARVAAWGWYERRLDLESSDGALLEDHDGAPVPAAPVWPRCLSWSDGQVAEVERWLAEGGDPPALLRERRMTDGTVELVEVLR